MQSYSQHILSKLLTARNTKPESLTATELGIANRIELCTLCTYLWVNRKRKKPQRCPNCHKRAWDRPLINLLLSQQQGADQ